MLLRLSIVPSPLSPGLIGQMANWYLNVKGSKGSEEGSDNPCSTTFLFLKLYRFINKHDGDIVFDGIHELAGIADKPALVFIQVNIALALGASEDRQKLGVNHLITSFQTLFPSQ
jgi:hypothetical protein